MSTVHPLRDPVCPFGEEYTRAEYEARAAWESAQFDMAINAGDRALALGHKRSAEAYALAAESRPTRRRRAASM